MRSKHDRKNVSSGELSAAVERPCDAMIHQARATSFKRRLPIMFMGAYIAAAAVALEIHDAPVFVGILFVGSVFLALVIATRDSAAHRLENPAMTIESSEHAEFQRLANHLASTLRSTEAEPLSLTPELVSAITRVLNVSARWSSPYYSPRLSLAIIDALAIRGQATCRDILIDVSQMSGLDAPRDRMAAAAYRAIAAIDDRIAREREGKTLLRPSLDGGTDTLPRPASNPTSSADSLLIAATGGEAKPS